MTRDNRFPMPFIMETDRAAARIADAIEKRRGELVMPWQIMLIKQILVRLLPVGVLERVLPRANPPSRTA